MSKTIAVVPVAYVHQALLKCEHYLEKAMQYAHRDYSMQEAKLALVNGQHTLLLFLENDEVVGANIFSFMYTANDSVFYIQATGGKTSKEHMELMFNYAKQCGATKVQASCRKSVARLCRQRYNFNETYTVIERNL